LKKQTIGSLARIAPVVSQRGNPSIGREEKS
jgi:hypothetical protein